MRFVANRNWYLIAIAFGSPYYWLYDALDQKTDRTTVTVSVLFTVAAVVLLIFLLRKQYLDVQKDRIVLQTPFRRKEWAAGDLQKVSIQAKIISAYDAQGKYHHLMIPLKPAQLERMKQEILAFCKRNKIPVTDKELELV